jgi:hypothetical protein
MFDMLLINYNRSGPTKNSLLLKVSSLARRPPDWLDGHFQIRESDKDHGISKSIVPMVPLIFSS